MGFAKAVADRMYFFDVGLIVETGTPKEVFTNPQEDRTKLFLSQILEKQSCFNCRGCLKRQAEGVKKLNKGPKMGETKKGAVPKGVAPFSLLFLYWIK
jgi:ABC-type methionine transport system ATPase subunit